MKRAGGPRFDLPDALPLREDLSEHLYERGAGEDRPGDHQWGLPGVSLEGGLFGVL